MREPFAAIRCGFSPDGSDALYRPAAIDFAVSSTSGAGDAATAADGFGDFVGCGDGVADAVGGTELEAIGEGVVAADAGSAELAVATVVGTCPDETVAPFATVKKFVASSYSRSPPTMDAVLTLPSERPSGLIFTTRP